MRPRLCLIGQRLRCPLSLRCTRTQSWRTWKWAELSGGQILQKQGREEGWITSNCINVFFTLNTNKAEPCSHLLVHKSNSSHKCLHVKSRCWYQVWICVFYTATKAATLDNQKKINWAIKQIIPPSPMWAQLKIIVNIFGFPTVSENKTVWSCDLSIWDIITCQDKSSIMNSMNSRSPNTSQVIKMQRPSNSILMMRSYGRPVIILLFKSATLN